MRAANCRRITAFAHRMLATSGTSHAWEHWRAIGSPRWVCAPMVDGSELAFRDLCRRYGVGLAYTPMLNAKVFAVSEQYRRDQFTTHQGDRPLAAQFCADDPETFVRAASLVQEYVDAVDLNLGCPQGIAKRGHYGAYLQDEWELIASIVRAAAENLTVPVWCKIRIFPSAEKTIAYARMLESAGCSLLAVHGRTREQKGKSCPPASWDIIRAVKRAVNIPVIANGNILSLQDAESALEVTEAEGVMSAFALLDNPANFSNQGGLQPSRLDLAREYLSLATKYETPMRIVRLHMFKLFRSRLDVNMDLNEKVAGCKSIEDFYAIANVLESRCDANGISFEQRVASGNVPMHVVCEKTLARRARSAAEIAKSSGISNSEEHGSTLGGDNNYLRPNLASGAYSARDVTLDDSCRPVPPNNVRQRSL